MKELLLDSIYTVEPKHKLNMWNNHWNYKWSGRNSLHLNDHVRWRKEGPNKYIVCDTNGKIWLMDEVGLNDILNN